MVKFSLIIHWVTTNTLQGRAEGLARKLESSNKGFAMLVRVVPLLFAQ